MSNKKPVDKDRLYFTQYNGKFPTRCPLCTEQKILRQCRTFHNFPALWRHIKLEHIGIPESQMKEISGILNSVYTAYQWNMFPKWEFDDGKIKKTTTSSSITHHGISKRIDFQERLEKIAKMLRLQSTFYPKFKERHLRLFIEKSIGYHDPRTMENYFEFVVGHSKRDNENGTYVVSSFCDLFVKIT